MYCKEYIKSKTPASHFCFIGKYRDADGPCKLARTDNQGFTVCMKDFDGTEEEFWEWYQIDVIEYNKIGGNGMSSTSSGTKAPKVEKTSLELLELVMYGNEATGEKDQAYEELKKQLTPPTVDEVCKALSEHYGLKVIFERGVFYKNAGGDTYDFIVLNELFNTPSLIELIGRVYKGGKQ